MRLLMVCLCIALFPCFIAAVHASPTFAMTHDDDPSANTVDWHHISPDLVMRLVSIIVLVLLGGVFAGLTLGLMGLDQTNLHVMMESGTESEKKNAKQVLRLLDRGKHWVLVTLLLSNVIVNETLPIILDSVFGGGWQAVLISTALIVIFGEVIPQSICVRHGLAIGARCSFLVLCIMYLMWPVAYPTAMLLDYFLGESQGTVYKKAGLKTLVSLHRSEDAQDAEGLTQDEVLIIGSVLDLREKSVLDVMTPIEDVFTLSNDHILDEETVNKILSEGYSRIPIHAPDDKYNFIGMLLVKNLITYDTDDKWPVNKFQLSPLPETGANTSCLDILNFFQEGRSHMALVSKNPDGSGGALGVITLEDVIEELIGEEIVDETDVYVDVHSKVKVARKRLQASSASYRPLFQIVRNNTKAGLRQPLPHRVSSRVNLRRAPSQEALLISQQANQHRPAEESDSGIERRIKGYGAVVDHETGDSSVLSTSYNDHRS